MNFDPFMATSTNTKARRKQNAASEPDKFPRDAAEAAAREIYVIVVNIMLSKKDDGSGTIEQFAEIIRKHQKATVTA